MGRDGANDDHAKRHTKSRFGILSGLGKYFSSWTPREVILLAIACVASLMAIAFSVAWFIGLTPMETVWGSVADWAGVTVTALGFLIAGLTFYLKFREVTQTEEEKRGQQDQEDLDSTFQLLQLTGSERERMENEASLVVLRLEEIANIASSEFPRYYHKYRVRFRVSNATGKKLTNLQLRIPQVTTHYGTWDATSIDLEDCSDAATSTEYLDILFAGPRDLIRKMRPDVQHHITDDADEAFRDKATLTFRIAGGPSWELIYNPSGKARPSLKL